jgi:transcription antitermination factor NusG
MTTAMEFRSLENVTRPLWFAVAVKSRHEKAVGEALGMSDIEHFVPVYRERRAWSDRTKFAEVPMFAGYVFTRFRYEERLRVLNTRGVISILGGGKVFSPVSDEQIASLRTIVNSGTQPRPCAYLAPGQVIQVERGPLAGIRGSIVRLKGQTCIVVSIEILQRSVAVEVDADAVRPIQARVRPIALAASAGQPFSIPQ